MDSCELFPCEYCGGVLGLYINWNNGNEHIVCVDCKKSPSEEYYNSQNEVEQNE